MLLIIFLLGCTPRMLNIKDDQPFIEPATGILFQSDICDIPKQGMTVFPRQKELGVGIAYQYEDRITATFYVFNAGILKIEDGIESDAVKAYFQQAIEDVFTMQKTGEYKNVTVVKQIEMDFQIQSEKLKALFAQFDLTAANLESGSFLLMTGFKNQFFKIRYTYPKEHEENAKTKWQCILNSFAWPVSEKNGVEHGSNFTNDKQQSIF